MTFNAKVWLSCKLNPIPTAADRFFLSAAVFNPILKPGAAVDPNAPVKKQLHSMVKHLRQWTQMLQTSKDPKLIDVAERMYYCRPPLGYWWLVHSGGGNTLLKRTCQLKICPSCYVRKIMLMRSKLALWTAGSYFRTASFKLNTAPETARQELLTAQKAARSLFRAQEVPVGLISSFLRPPVEPADGGKWSVIIQGLSLDQRTPTVGVRSADCTFNLLN